MQRMQEVQQAQQAQQGLPWSSQAAGNGFAFIGEDEYSSDPPPAYSKIGPSAPTPGDAGGCFVVRDTRRRRSFGIGGAGNIRTTKEAAIVALSAAAAAAAATTTSTSSTTSTTSRRTAEARRSAASPHATPTTALGGRSPTAGSSASSGASDLRDIIVDGVRTILSRGGHGGAHAAAAEGELGAERPSWQ